MYVYPDPELGPIFVKPDRRAKNVTARRKPEGFTLTVPWQYGEEDVRLVIKQMKPRLLQLTFPPKSIIDEDTTIDTFSFRATMRRYALSQNFRMTLKNGELTVFVPQEADISSPDAQEAIRELIRQGMRLEAKRILTQKTALFATKHHLIFNGVKINKSLSRWGSCSRQKSINFSFYLLLLPENLIDYVILHELAHTVEMNHGERFWRLLDTLCGEDSKNLARQARSFKSREYDLLRE